MLHYSDTDDADNADFIFTPLPAIAIVAKRIAIVIVA